MSEQVGSAESVVFPVPESPKNKDTPFLSLEMASQHKIVFTKVSIYVGLVVLYLLSFLTIGVN